MRGNARATRPEATLRSALHRAGLRFRKNVRPMVSIRCRPDVVFPTERIAVFVDGCFWHSCPEHFRPPKKRTLPIGTPRSAEMSNETRGTTRESSRAGWRVIRVWEHEDLESAAERVRASLCMHASGPNRAIRIDRGVHRGPLLRTRIQSQRALRPPRLLRVRHCQLWSSCLFASEPTVAPFLFSLETPEAERIARRSTRSAPTPRLLGAPSRRASGPDSVRRRGKLGCGVPSTWAGRGRGRRYADFGVHLDSDLLVGLDPLLYAELPMGISVEFKDAEVEAITETGWITWERVDTPGCQAGERPRFRRP